MEVRYNVASSSVSKFLVEEIDIDLGEDKEELNLAGLDSFRKGMFRVPLYLVEFQLTRSKKTRHSSERRELVPLNLIKALTPRTSLQASLVVRKPRNFLHRNPLQ